MTGHVAVRARTSGKYHKATQAVGSSWLTECGQIVAPANGRRHTDRKPLPGIIEYTTEADVALVACETVGYLIVPLCHTCTWGKDRSWHYCHPNRAFLRGPLMENGGPFCSAQHGGAE